MIKKLGFIFVLLSLIGVAFSYGFHYPYEIWPGTFNGDYSFNGSVGIGTDNDLIVNDKLIFTVEGISDYTGTGHVGRAVRFKPSVIGNMSGIGGITLTPQIKITSNIGTAYGNILTPDLYDSDKNLTNYFANFFRADLNNYSGTIENVNTIYVSSPSVTDSGDAVIENLYGIRIKDLTNAVNSYAIYSEGNNDISYFAGNVGIGTTTPSEKLEINGNQFFNYDNVIKWGEDYNFIGAEGSGLEGLKLVYEGGINVIIDSNNDATSRAFTISKDNVSAVFATPLFTVEESGNVGIGTTTPLAKLEIEGTTPSGTTNATSVDARWLTLKNTQSSEGDHKWGIVFDGSDSYSPVSYMMAVGDYSSNYNGGLVFGTRPSVSGDALERMRITSAGRVGIGTYSPSSKLHIESLSGGHGSGLFVNSNVGSVNFWGGSISGLVMDIRDGTINGGAGDLYIRSGGVDSLFIKSNGDIGIGDTSPDAPLDVQADLVDGEYFMRVEESSTYLDGFFGIAREDSINSKTLLSIGTNNRVWVDSADILRISSVAPSSDTAGTVIGTQTSDERLKNEIRELSYGLDEVMQLVPIKYEMYNKTEIGFGAQTTLPIIPEAVYDTGELLENSTRLAMDYSRITPVLVNAIQELKQEKDNDIEFLKSENDLLKQELCFNNNNYSWC